MDPNIILDSDLIRRYDVNGPRYTSYPTALQFQDFTEADLRKTVLASQSTGKDLSLYLHIPFCATLCYYCACNKIVTKQLAPAKEYLELIKQEIAMQAKSFANRRVTQIHWGGGTPTFLDDDQIRDLMRYLGQLFNVCDDEDGEFSIEIDPRTVDRERIRALRASGFNRLSFGIQDFDAKVQKAVNRVQSFEQTQSVIEAAREFDFRSVSVDLIYGLPHQSVDSFANTLKQIKQLSPDRISIYNYAHMPSRFFPQTRIVASDLPASDEKLEILKLSIQTLTDGDYVYIGMDHFAKPNDELAIAQREGSLHRNFQGYSTRAECDLLAFGVTAISQLGATFSQNTKDLEQYTQLINAKQIPVQKGVELDQDDLIRQSVIRSFTCQYAVNMSDVANRFGIDTQIYFANELATLAPMCDDGLVELRRNVEGQVTHIHVLPRGRLLIRNICMVFDRYLKHQTSLASYSKAI